MFIAIFALTFANQNTIKPLSYDLDKAKLGKKLFFESKLSANGRSSCEKCHNLYWEMSGTTREMHKINPPTVLNVAYQSVFYYPKLNHNLFEQSANSILLNEEMNNTKENVVKTISSDESYKEMFNKTYGEITFDNIVDALVQFQRTLTTPNSKFDQYINGDNSALNEDELAGYEIFRTIGCNVCHNGVNLGGNLVSVKILKQKAPNPKPKRVPSLRNISKTAPYFYDGNETDLKSAVRRALKYNFMTKLSDKQVENLVKFLYTLEGDLSGYLKLYDEK